MYDTTTHHQSSESAAIGALAVPRTNPRPSKKERILEFYRMGVTNLAELAVAVNSRPGYVARVLTEAGLLSGYFDLYTTTGSLMNFHSRFSRGIIRFKTPEAARASVKRIDDLYHEFESRKDRAGQHHVEILALIGINRARSCGKRAEARIFADWLIERLKEI